MSQFLRDRWSGLLRPFDPPQASADKCFRALMRRYGHRRRHYHCASHLEAMFKDLEIPGSFPMPTASVRFAIFYHDAIYRTYSRSNERHSAILACRDLRRLGVAEEIVHDVERLILLTVDHPEDCADSDGRLFLDLDMAILGADPATYDAYAAGVRKEYALMPATLYDRGRRRFLEGQLAKRRIYLTNRFHAELEGRARSNLRRETDSLVPRSNS